MESSEGVNIVLIVILASLGMLTLVMFIVMFVVFYQKRMLEHKNILNEKENIYQKKLLEATVEVAELERQKIAANVHDDVGMALQVLKLSFTKIKRNQGNTELLNELIDSNTTLLEDTSNLVRSIAHELMPGTLVKIGLVGGLSDLCRKIAEAQMLIVNFSSINKSIEIDKKKELHIYRLLKELINNIIKHDKPTQLEINIDDEREKLQINISHNGKGISNEDVNRLIDSNRGIGLKSIFSRVQLTGSKINYFSNVDGNAKITVVTPLP